MWDITRLKSHILSLRELFQPYNHQTNVNILINFNTLVYLYLNQTPCVWEELYLHPCFNSPFIIEMVQPFGNLLNLQQFSDSLQFPVTNIFSLFSFCRLKVSAIHSTERLRLLQHSLWIMCCNSIIALVLTLVPHGKASGCACSVCCQLNEEMPGRAE